ncbi:MAG: PD-(D/E)XK nuclease family protein [Pseudomonadales bacterium]|nr:PD-(D/E)XK nuclease family protein [Pseudomonadales bacterium]
MPDKFQATWVSHTSLSDFLHCPRAYFLKNVYKNPDTNRKMQIMSPALALGQAVHDTVERLSILPVQQRFAVPLLEKFENSWKKVSGKKGGFTSESQEQTYQERGEAMIRRVTGHPGPLKRKAVKIKEDLPWYWLSEEDEIILCGKIDWLEYLEETDNVHIIDFKTGRSKENESSLQLPIYLLLAQNTQQRSVAKASYWYLDSDDAPTEKHLPNPEQAHETILEHAKKMKLARKLGHFKCPTNGCRHCTPFERILKGEGEKVGVNDFNQDIFILPFKESEKESTIL